MAKTITEADVLQTLRDAIAKGIPVAMGSETLASWLRRTTAATASQKE